MQVEWVTLCKYAEHGETSRIEQYGMCILYISKPGVTVKFYLAMCLSDLNESMKIETLFMRFIAPSGKHVATYQHEIGVELIDIPELRQLQGYSAALEVPIRETGIYTIEVYTADHDSKPERKRLQVLVHDMPGG